MLQARDERIERQETQIQQLRDELATTKEMLETAIGNIKIRAHSQKMNKQDLEGATEALARVGLDSTVVIAYGHIP